MAFCIHTDQGLNSTIERITLNYSLKRKKTGKKRNFYIALRTGFTTTLNKLGLRTEHEKFHFLKLLCGRAKQRFCRKFPINYGRLFGESRHIKLL